MLNVIVRAELPSFSGEIVKDDAGLRKLPAPSTRTGTSPISLIRVRYSGVRVWPLKKSTQIGCQSSPHNSSISAAL